MDKEDKHLSLDEVRRALDRLRSPDIVRLSMFAKLWASGLARRGANDLLNEAFDRALSGRRPWPSDLGLAPFLNGVMRSISNQWKREDLRETLIEDAEGGDVNEIEDGTSIDHDIRDLVARMRHALREDKAALGILNHILADTDREEAQAALGLDAQGYDTARRRMVRLMFNMFNPGWQS